MKEKLYPFHVSLLVYMIQTGVIIFSLPRLLAQHMGYNGWITLFAYTGVVMLNIYLISLVYRLSNGKSIFQIIEQALPKVIVLPLYFILVSVWTMLGCLVAKQYVFIFQAFVFPTTHPMFMKFLVDVLAYLLIIKGIYNISKAATSFFWLVIWTLLLLLFFVKNFQWVNLTPFFFQESTDFFLGGLSIFSSFLGYELALLLFPYVEKNKSFIKAVHIGNLLTAITYITVSLTCFGFYSFNQLQGMKYPVIDLLAQIKFPFVERVDNIIFSLFLFTTLITIVAYIWAAKETVHRVIPRANSKWLAGTIVGIAFAVAWIPDVLNEVELWIKFLGYMEIGIAFGLPLFLLIILLLSKGGKKHV